MLKRLAALLVLALSVAALSGCVAIEGVAPSQTDVGQPVRIQVTFCVTDRETPPSMPEHPGCEHSTNDPDDVSEGFAYQAFLGFRLPDGVAVPDEFDTTPDPALTFALDDGYTDELERLAPAGPGQVWVGYVSNGYPLDSYPAGEPARTATVAPEFDLPESSDGAPFAGPFRYRVVAGGRWASDQPVQCGAGPTGGDVTCIDSPLMAFVATSASFATSDAGIVAGNATVSQGQSASLPFFVRVAGDPGPGKVATLSASTTLPGASVAPQPASVPLVLNGNERVEVPVSVPANASPGDYEVRLTAELPGGATRTTAARLTVRTPAPPPSTPPPSTPPPVVDRTKPALAKPRLGNARFKAGKGRKRGTAIRYALSEAAKVRFAIQRCAKGKGGKCRRPKAAGAVLDRGEAGANSFRFSGIVKGRRLKPGRYRFSVTATDAAGNATGPVRVAFAVRR